MKIRYSDLYMLSKCFKNQYNKSIFTLKYIYNLKYYFRFNFYLIINEKFKNNLLNDNDIFFKIFKFSIFFTMLNFSKFKNFNIYRVLFFYFFYLEYFFYLKKFFLLYWNLIKIDENIIFLTSEFFFLLNKKFIYKTDSDIINFLIKNRIKYIFNIDGNLSKSFVHKLYEFDICLINLHFNDVKSKYLLLNFLYYLKEYNIYLKNLSML